jgi:hypothetical protein
MRSRTPSRVERLSEGLDIALKDGLSLMVVTITNIAYYGKGKVLRTSTVIIVSLCRKSLEEIVAEDDGPE